MERNLRSLRAIDAFADTILSQCLHVAVYTFSQETKAWKREDVAGPFFIYSRKDKPYISFIVVNRQNPDDLIQPILPQMQFELQPSYIFINKGENRTFFFCFYVFHQCFRKHILLAYFLEDITGLWFTNEEECTRAHSLFEELKSISMPYVPTITS